MVGARCTVASPTIILRLTSSTDSPFCERRPASRWITPDAVATGGDGHQGSGVGVAEDEDGIGGMCCQLGKGGRQQLTEALALGALQGPDVVRYETQPGEDVAVHPGVVVLTGGDAADLVAGGAQGVDDGGELDDLGPGADRDGQSQRAHPSKTSQKWRSIRTPGRPTSRSGRTDGAHDGPQVLLDQLGAGGERQRQAAGEARVDLVDDDGAVVGDEALDVGRTDQADGLEHLAGQVEHLVVVEGLALGRDAGLGLEPPPGDPAGHGAGGVHQHVAGELAALDLGLHDRLGARARARRARSLLGRGRRRRHASHGRSAA